MQNYSLFERVLHDITLGNKFIKKSLYEIEKIFFLKEFDIKYKKHVFITGLPRSGTTVLLNFLHLSKKFCSLKYLNMPFVMAPNLSRLFHKKKISNQERYHQDGIFFDLDSPEAFDEVFFSSLKTTEIKDELLNYIQLILFKNKEKRYLSKNNSNYKRINLLLSLLPNSSFLIPIREPLQHSYSLLSQHLHFLKLQKQNDFIRRYMNYLGHNEFGKDHISWKKPIKYLDNLELNYWLEQWVLFYQNIYRSYFSHPSCKFIIYEKLNNESIINDITNFTEIEKCRNFEFKVSRKNFSMSFDKKLYKQAEEIYLKFI